MDYGATHRWDGQLWGCDTQLGGGLEPTPDGWTNTTAA